MLTRTNFPEDRQKISKFIPIPDGFEWSVIHQNSTLYTVFESGRDSSDVTYDCGESEWCIRYRNGRHKYTKNQLEVVKHLELLSTKVKIKLDYTFVADNQ